MKSKELISILCFFILITGCGLNEKMEGYILEVAEGSILFAEDASMEEYDEWKDLTYDELLEASPKPSLIKLTYEDVEKLQKGDYVQVKLEGDVAALFPGQAKAKKVQLK